MSRQREVIYRERRRVLEGEDLRDWIRTMIASVTDAYVVGGTEGVPQAWDTDQLWTAFKTIYPISLTIDGLEEQHGGRSGLTRDLLQQAISADALEAYDRREEELGAEVMRELERRVVLSVIDRKWREHLYEMDYLREGIGLRAYSQRDPLVEYQREGFDLFAAMMDGIQEESIGFLFNLDVQIDAEIADDADDAENADAEQPHIHAKGLDREKQTNLSYSAPSDDGSGETSVRSGDTDVTAEQVLQHQRKQKSKSRTKTKAQTASRKRNR